MRPDHIETLKSISLAILHSGNRHEETAAAARLSDFYHSLAADENIGILKSNESALDGGLALSSYDAAICVDEHLRTARFIKGVYQAIETLGERFPHEQINILYAGCGPYATLVLPLLPLLDLQRYRITFLDIHSPSLQSVSQLMHAIGIGHFPVQLVQADALTYQYTQPLHLVVTETMFSALNREPQVSITKNLAPQLTEGGILIPEEINIDLVYTFFAKEPFFNIEKQSLVYEQPPYANRKVVERLFCISKHPAFFTERSGNRFISKVYTLPHQMDEMPDICVFTELVVFKDIKLEPSTSTITNPFGISSSIHYEKGVSFWLEYHFDHIPGWEIKIPAN